MSKSDHAIVAAQLGREPRGMVAVAHRCSCGLPDVVQTAPRLPDGTPFPTTFYLTCPRAAAALSRLEASGVMREMTARLATDPALAEAYAAAHRDYLARRAELGDVAEIDGISAGGMPDRVKCLHALAAHALAAGPGVNPFGDEAITAAGDWGRGGPCVSIDDIVADVATVRRVAAIDCGTNTLRMLVAEVTPAGLRDVLRRAEIVRLGAGVDQTRRLQPEALARTAEVLRDYHKQLSELEVSSVRFVATSAVRDAENAAEFSALIRSILDIESDVITGDEEARLTFAGAAAGVPLPALVIDIGGGSTELIRGDGDGEARGISLDIGSVRLTERHLLHDPPLPSELAALVEGVRAALLPALERVPAVGIRSSIGVAGTVTTLAALAAGIRCYAPGCVHHARLSLATVRGLIDELAAKTSTARVVPDVLPPGRADVIVAGAVILAEVMAAYQLAEIIVSETDILDGIAQSVAG